MVFKEIEPPYLKAGLARIIEKLWKIQVEGRNLSILLVLWPSIEQGLVL